MQDSIKHLACSVSYDGTNAPLENHANEAISALEALGYKRQESLKVIKKINDGSQSSEQLIRKALQLLSNHTQQVF